MRWFTTVACPRCGGVIFIEHNEKNAVDNHLVNATPEDASAASWVSDLPEDVADFFNGADRVLQAGVPDAAAVQLRKTLEAAVKAAGIQGKGSLAAQLAQLAEAGHVTERFSEALRHVRIIGNIGAHASHERLTSDQVHRAMRFTTQFLRNLFEIPAELDRLDAAADEDDE